MQLSYNMEKNRLLPVGGRKYRDIEILINSNQATFNALPLGVVY
jgi:hypothetical protein